MTGVLVVNAGSSSLKLRVLDQADAVTASADLSGWNGSPDDAGLRRFLDGLTGIGAAGHRVVHGGHRFTAATLIDDAVLAGIDELTGLAPLHQPRAHRGRGKLRGAWRVDAAFWPPAVWFPRALARVRRAPGRPVPREFG